MLEKSKIIKVNVEIFHYIEKVPVKDIVKDFKKKIKKLLNAQKIFKSNKKEKGENENEKNLEETKSNPDELQPEIDIDIRQLNSGKKRYFSAFKFYLILTP